MVSAGSWAISRKGLISIFICLYLFSILLGLVCGVTGNRAVGQERPGAALNAPSVPTAAAGISRDLCSWRPHPLSTNTRAPTALGHLRPGGNRLGWVGRAKLCRQRHTTDLVSLSPCGLTTEDEDAVMNDGRGPGHWDDLSSSSTLLCFSHEKYASFKKIRNANKVEKLNMSKYENVTAVAVLVCFLHLRLCKVSLVQLKLCSVHDSATRSVIRQQVTHVSTRYRRFCDLILNAHRAVHGFRRFPNILR